MPESLSSLNVKGLVLQAGTFTPVVGDQPQKVILTPEFVKAAYQVLKRDVAAGQVVMRLAHPGLGGFPLNFGRVTGVGIDQTVGRVYVTNTEVDPAWEHILTPEAREQLYDFAFSVDARITFTPAPDGGLQAQQAIRFDGIDIVETGAFTGRGLLHEVPMTVMARLLAQLKGNPAPGTESGANPTNRSSERMPKLETVNDIPEDVKTQLTPEQQAAYLTAYNQAIEAGTTPEEAHQQAMTAAGSIQATQGEDNPNKKEPAEEMKALKAQLARVKAKADQATILEAEVKRLKAQAARTPALETEVAQLRAQLATTTDEKGEIENRVLALEKRALAAEEEREMLVATEDVKQVLASGKEPPHRRETVMDLRRTLGHEKFVKHYKDAPIRVKAGEIGHVQQVPPGTVTPEAEARQVFAQYGAIGAQQAGLTARTDAFGVELRKLIALERGGGV